ncbi:MAG: class I SAM-dependent methyltransferase [Candidatus Komeilibacteria bacterium]|nr:class I SAM-dependent methyltransferase [Candidatus Komeilibacteria bacterium]
MPNFEEITDRLKARADFKDGIFLFLPKISQFQQKEIVFHNQIHNSEEEIHQLNALRNRYYHDYFKKPLFKLPPKSVILEIGAGSGYDLLPLLKQGYCIIASDISLESIKAIKQKMDSDYPQFKERIVYLAADGQNLPLASAVADACFTVASLHHFENQRDALKEMLRVTSANGLLIMAMEPSRWMMFFTKLFKNKVALRIRDGHSEADETHPGYLKNDLIKLIPPGAKWQLKRVWLTQGFLHYGLEGIYRLFKLKKRIKIPIALEVILLGLDEVLLKIPVINWLNWHWILIIRKNIVE